MYRVFIGDHLSFTCMRETVVKSVVPVSPSAFSQRHSLGDVVYFFLCYYNMQHMQMYCLVLQKGRQSSVHVDKNVWWLDLTINNLHGL